MNQSDYLLLTGQTPLEKSHLFMTIKEVCSVIPESFIVLSALFILLFAILAGCRSQLNFPLTHPSAINLSVMVLMSAVLLLSKLESVTPEIVAFNYSVVLDTLSICTKKCLILTCFLCLIITKLDLKKQQINSFEYTVLVLFSTFGAVLISSSNDLITAYLAIEVQSLAFYILASFKKTSTFSIDAGLKYFILGALGSGTFLFGTSLVYGVTGTTNFEHFHELYSHEYNLTNTNHHISNSSFLQFGLVLLLCSLLFKVSVAPFHIWSPDVYEGSLSCSTFLFTVLPKLGLFVLITRVFFYSFSSFTDKFGYLLILAALLSIFVGSFGGLEQKKVKTLLAFSSIGHMGYSLLAFSSGVIEGIQVMYGYLLVYMLTGISIWSVFFITSLKQPFNKHNKDLADFSSIVKSNPTLSTCLAITCLSLAGFPPFVGFYVKMAVFSVSIEAGFYNATVFAILCGVISTYYYIRIIKVSFFEQTISGNLYYPAERNLSLIMAFCASTIIVSFINPSALYLYCYNVSLFGLN